MLQTFIFIGRSGCGKGTQAELIQKMLKEESPKTPIYYLESGARFREFIQKESYSSKLSKEIYEADLRQPDFLAVWNWAHLFVDALTGNEHLVIDGTPRSLAEAKVLDTAMKFYQRSKPYVIHINVSRKWSEERLLARGRMDDATLQKIDQRLNWFDSDVMPAVDYYRSSGDYKFLEINGEQSIEKVFADIKAKL